MNCPGFSLLYSPLMQDLAAEYGHISVSRLLFQRDGNVSIAEQLTHFLL